MIIITSPSLDPLKNVSGISSVTRLIIENNASRQYSHFQIGKTDDENSAVRRVVRLLGTYFKWINTLCKRDIDLLHYNFPLSNFSILRDSVFIHTAFLFRKKLVIHMHGGVYLTQKNPPLLLNWILKKILKKDVPIVVLSEREKECLSQRYDCKNIRVLPNCVAEVDGVKDNRQDRSVLNILFLGRIAKDKGIQYILESAKQLVETGYDFKLHFAGEEEFKDEFIPVLKRELGRNFYYHGIVSGESKDSLLREMDIFLLPSFYEGLPMALLETMSYGIIPVVTNVGSIGSVINDGENGLFIKDHDTQSIFKVIEGLITDSSKRGELSEKAIQTIRDKFNAKHYIDQLNDIYDELLNK